MLDVVLMGHREMWQVRQEKDAIYANPDATEDDYVRAAELESTFAEQDGYTAEARAGELLLGVGIAIELHDGPMSAVAPGWKLRVLLAQALFSNPDILLLDEPTNNLDINSIRWLESVLNERSSTMVIISHDRHFLNSVCTHMADLDYGSVRVYPGNYDDYMIASTQARAQLLSVNAKAKEKIADLQEFVRRFSANKSKARQATSRARQIEKIKLEDVKPSSRQNPYIRFEVDPKQKLHRHAVEIEPPRQGLAGPAARALRRREPHPRRGRAARDRRPQRRRQDHAAAHADRRARARHGHREMGGESLDRLLHAGPDRRVRFGRDRVRLDAAMGAGRRRRADRAGDAGAAAVFGRRRQEAGARAVRRREGADALRQADAACGPTCW